MQNYLILYVDVEFIVGAIGTGYGNPHVISIEGDILQWLYFFNDPHLHTVSFGKKYKKHYMDGEVNYYGKFLHSIENKDASFSLRHVDYPLIEMLEVSGMLKMWETEYNHTTQSVPETIPTLLTFSSSISDLAKQNFVDYLRVKGFDIKSYTIPLSELALKKLLIDGKINSDDGKATLMIEATNATLHFTKLVYHDQYFMKDGDVKSIQGKGIDPRKRALCKFLVGEMNSLTGLLSTEDEKEEEIERLEPQSADWLKKIDAQPGTRPFIIRNISFKIAKHITRDILVNKENLESDTGRYVQYLTDEYSAFKNEFCPNGIGYCCFVGNCFVSDRIKERFESIVGKERAFFFRTTDVADIICVYPRIDLQRYADEENRIKAKAEADALKQQAERDEQRKREEAKAKADEEARRIAEEKQRKDSAEKAYQRSLDLDKQGNLDDAKANVDISVNLVPEELKYRQFADYLTDKIKKQRETLQLYKTYLLAGDKFCNEGKYSEALIEYEKAKSVDDNAEIKGKIIECNVRIKEQKKQKEKIEELLIEIKTALASRNVELAEAKVNEVLSLDSANRAIKGYSAEILRIRKEEEEKEREEERKRTIEKLLLEAEKQFSKRDYESALGTYNQALSLDPRNGSIKLKVKECKNAVDNQLIKNQISNIENDIQIALQKKDFEKASQLYSKLEQIDVENAATWRKKNDDISYLLNLSLPRFVKGEIANIKAMLRLEKFADAKEQLTLLENNLHLLDNNSYDTDIASLYKSFGNGNDVVKKKEPRHIEPHPNKPEVLPSENDKKDKEHPKGAPKNIVKSQLNYAEVTTMTDRDIIRRTREIKALISQGHTKEAEAKLCEMAKQLTCSDFQKYKLADLQQKINENN